MAAQKHESKYKEEDRWGELRDCEDPIFTGTKSGSRPVVFCKPVTALSSLTVNGPTTLNLTSVVPPQITVGGRTYVPTQISVPVFRAGTSIISSWNVITVLASQG